ncbi:MAG: hypothetical protein ATN34_02290 [Epulopiscium sp. Nele67-Bin002]|nr:MAG: hypothetical protein BEN18_08185 [Epulopiscium sp. Nuni2H_MBin001]OON91323.1 MAG: hypothetical protein ATN34_02290 [Epulopiscium sp. Nele67-Bin002]OON91378.1 MAG: hypothetical protein ATN33_01335 [Epulopiscium sp. Nele67-Bin001]
MKKRFSIAMLALMLATTPVMASTNLIINGEVITSQTVIEVNGTTLVPVRLVSEMLGAEVEWDEYTEAISISKDYDVISFKIAEDTALINGVSNRLAAAPIISDEITMVPLIFVSQALGVSVGFDELTNTVLINSTLADLEQLPARFDCSEIVDGRLVDYYTLLPELENMGIEYVPAAVDGVELAYQLIGDGINAFLYLQRQPEGYLKITGIEMFAGSRYHGVTVGEMSVNQAAQWLGLTDVGVVDRRYGATAVDDYMSTYVVGETISEEAMVERIFVEFIPYMQ